MKRTTGHFEPSSTAGESFKAFVPNPLPPDPPIEWTPRLHGFLEKASRAVGRLDGLVHTLPTQNLHKNCLL